MKIYTGRGDEGETDLRSGGRVSKSSTRIEAYGAVDEANAAVGVAAESTAYEDVVGTLEEVQQKLFRIQADLADPEDTGPSVDEDDADWLEDECDRFDEELEPLESFVLPAGPAASVHQARSVVRRSERRCVQLQQQDGDVEDVLVVLNRVSDLLFVLARVVNHREGFTEISPSY